MKFLFNVRACGRISRLTMNLPHGIWFWININRVRSYQCSICYQRYLMVRIVRYSLTFRVFDFLKEISVIFSF